ncbi:right-handed parallel beta-helix repeat-containing protein [Streptomyces sp. NRRL S-920]|uniref:right-handed parallel beta-helix repeat-containing protein n=1 Tax=Streptomyces sp. NRRL S-920 TaxID=1463921 RepID=UPI000A609A3C|nr:right-handed parallel beta-helix repeat-containing protein [Streptomyces sp. NRRL S-920]
MALALPASIPTVTVHGTYLGPDGRPLAGTVTFNAPSMLTFPASDVFIAGPVVAPLDENGRFSVRLPATDAPDMQPSGWAYLVKENLSGVIGGRTFNVVLPKSLADVDLADIVTADPTTPHFVPVPGLSAYQVALENGYQGTEAEWVASLKGAKGDPGNGSVDSVNGYLGPQIILKPADVGALAATGGVVTGVVRSQLASATATALAAIIGAETFDRWRARADGYMAWGSGVADRDTTLYRSGVGSLATDGAFSAREIAGARSVRAYGARGDGSTNDAPSFQAALDAVYAAGGGQVIVPAGTYLLSTLPLRIRRNTRLTMLPGAILRRGAAETLILNGDAGQTFGGYEGHGNIVIEGGTLDMRGTANGLTAPAMCISIGHARNVTIQGVEIRDVSGYHAVELNSTEHGIIRGCRFLGYVDPGQRDFSEAVQLDLAKMSGVFGGFGPYDHQASQDIEISGCYFGPSGTPGTTAWPRGIGSHSATIDRWHRRIRIVGNSFRDLSQYAVSAYNWEDLTVSANTFQGCGSGVRLRSVISTDPEDTKKPDGTVTNASQLMRDIAITGNVLRSCGAYDEPIVVLGEATGVVQEVTVTGNTVVNSSGNAMRFQRAERVSVFGNVISGATGTGISTELCSLLTATGNQVLRCGGNGLTAVNGTSVSFTANNIIDPAQTGVLVQGGADIQIQTNLISGPGSAANATYYGIRLSSGANSARVVGNKVRPNGSGNQAISALSITDTCRSIARHGNDLRGSWTGTALGDDSPSPATSAADITS